MSRIMSNGAHITFNGETIDHNILSIDIDEFNIEVICFFDSSDTAKSLGKVFNKEDYTICLTINDNFKYDDVYRYRGHSINLSIDNLVTVSFNFSKDI